MFSVFAITVWITQDCFRHSGGERLRFEFAIVPGHFAVFGATSNREDSAAEILCSVAKRADDF